MTIDSSSTVEQKMRLTPRSLRVSDVVRSIDADDHLNFAWLRFVNLLYQRKMMRMMMMMMMMIDDDLADCFKLSWAVF